MSKIPFSISDRSLSFYVNGQPYSIARTSPNWDELKALIQSADPDVQRLIALTNPVQVIREAVEAAEAAVAGAPDYLPRGVVSVTRNSVEYNGEQLDGVLVDRILDLLAEGFDIMPMVRFLENLFTNPATYARDELYLWLEKADLPITQDGFFLAYKRVNDDFTSIHDGRTKNDPGLTVSIPRSQVDTERAHTCSTGLHFASKEYLVGGPGGFGGGYSDAPGSKIVLLKINPADVVSIPNDYDNSKGRAWKYEVIEQVKFDFTQTTWPSVVDLDDDEDEVADPDRETIVALFAAYGEIVEALGAGKGRQARIDWANDMLYEAFIQGDLDEDDYDGDDAVESFNDLTEVQARLLIDVAHQFKADLDADVEADTKVVLDKAEAVRREAINSYGIITLRAKASAAGWTNDKGGSAWKGPKAAELKAYLIEKGVV